MQSCISIRGFETNEHEWTKEIEKYGSSHQHRVFNIRALSNV